MTLSSMDFARVESHAELARTGPILTPPAARLLAPQVEAELDHSLGDQTRAVSVLVLRQTELLRH